MSEFDSRQEKPAARLRSNRYSIDPDEAERQLRDEPPTVGTRGGDGA